jgi:hypothetical protein
MTIEGSPFTVLRFTERSPGALVTATVHWRLLVCMASALADGGPERAVAVAGPPEDHDKLGHLGVKPLEPRPMC